MTSTNFKLEILARRATFCAMALAGAGGATTACDKNEEKPEVAEGQDEVMCLSVAAGTMPKAKGQEGAMGRPVPCLRGTLAPSSATAVLDQDYPLVIKDKGKVAASGTVEAKVEGPSVPHAAEIATGAHFRARTRRCFLDAVAKGIKLEGEATLTLEVSGKGSVERVTTGGTLDEGLRACLGDNVKKLGFHPVKGGGASKVIIEVRF